MNVRTQKHTHGYTHSKYVKIIYTSKCKDLLRYRKNPFTCGKILLVASNPYCYSGTLEFPTHRFTTSVEPYP